MKPNDQSKMALAAAAVLALSGCDQQESDADEPAAEPTPTPSASPISIIRSEIEQAKELPLAPLAVRISFAEGGSELDDAAKGELSSILESPQYEAGGHITLRGHTDSSGSDEANLRASLERAEAVRDYLVEEGAAKDRFTIIAIGEQNPVAPNAKPDGAPNEEGRRANRRVEVTVAASSSSNDDEATGPQAADAGATPDG